MECPKCRQYNLPGSSFCEKCGNNLKLAQRQPPPPGRGYESAGHGYGYSGGYGSPGPAARPTPAQPPTPSYPGAQPSIPQPPPAPPPPPPRAATPAAPPPPRQAAAKPAPPPPPPNPAEPPPFGVLRALADGRDIPLRWDRNLVGRQSQADNIQPQVDLSPLGEGGVSRRHAQIVREDGVTHLEDLGSSNGTFVNGVQLQPGLQQPLQDKDEVRFGSLRFQYHQTR